MSKQNAFSFIKNETSNYKRSYTTIDICLIGLFIALEIVFKTILTFSVWDLKIGLGFLPVAVAARRYGYHLALPIAFIGDFVGWAVKPTGPYYPAFAVSAVLTALITCFFIYKKCSLLRIISYVIINNVVFTIIVNSFWIHILYGAPYWPLVVKRASLEAPLMAVIEIAAMFSIFLKADKALIKNFPGRKN